MKEMAGLFGWIGVWGYVVALLNFFIKYINKKYINKLPKDKKTFISTYRIIMRFLVKYHKIAGVIASIAVVVHLYLMYNVKGLSIPGLVAAIVMWIVFSLGIYGFGINKNMKAPWVKIHRILSFVLILLIVFHIMFLKVLFIHK